MILYGALDDINLYSEIQNHVSIVSYSSQNMIMSMVLKIYCSIFERQMYQSKGEKIRQIHKQQVCQCNNNTLKSFPIEILLLGENTISLRTLCYENFLSAFCGHYTNTFNYYTSKLLDTQLYYQCSMNNVTNRQI